MKIGCIIELHQKKLIKEGANMIKTIPLNSTLEVTDFAAYEKRFKALADQKRLHLLAILCKEGSACVCDLTDLLDIPQSKLSYHLKILLDADIIMKQKRVHGTTTR